MTFLTRRNLLSLLFLLFMPMIASANANLSIDQAIEDILRSGQSPFISEKAAKEHPSYEDLLFLAHQLNAEVRWVRSVAGSVRRLPPHKDRYLFSGTDEFDGWFDEFTTPNLILIHRQATLVILLHELRHALHLGSHGVVGGNKFDRAVRQAKLEVETFHQTLKAAGLSPARSRRLKKLSTRLVESFSEVMAHHGDHRLAVAFKTENAQTQLDFMKEYELEFLQALKALKADSHSGSQGFVMKLEKSFESFRKELTIL